VHSKQGRYMKRKRQSTVEPVFGTLTQKLVRSEAKSLAFVFFRNTPLYKGVLV